jgi:hypothetical protein
LPEEPLLPGVPSHLKYPLFGWLVDTLRDAFGEIDPGRVNNLSMRARVAFQASWTDGTIQRLGQICEADDEVFLDLIDAALSLPDGWRLADELQRIFDLSGSHWRVADDRRSLQEIPSRTDLASFQASLAGSDRASAELEEAWALAYGRSPNAADVWDHCIKAVEEIYISLVIPKKANANLGAVIGQLSAQPHLYHFAIRGQQSAHGVEAVIEMLRLLWPDPNRHGGGQPAPPATLPEARAVLHCAVTLVNWGRAGALTKR